jgi:hypothetical protein
MITNNIYQPIQSVCCNKKQLIITKGLLWQKQCIGPRYFLKIQTTQQYWTCHQSNIQEGEEEFVVDATEEEIDNMKDSNNVTN